MDGSLQRVVNGIGLVFQSRKVTVPQVRTGWVGIVAAGNAEINQRLAGNRCATRTDCVRTAVAGINRISAGVINFRCDGLSGGYIRIGRSSDRHELVQVRLLRKVSA